MLTTAAHSSPVRRATSGTFSALTSIHSPRKAPACAACCSGVSGGITSAVRSRFCNDDAVHEKLLRIAYTITQTKEHLQSLVLYQTGGPSGAAGS